MGQLGTALQNVITDYFSDQKHTILGGQGMEKVVRCAVVEVSLVLTF